MTSYDFIRQQLGRSNSSWKYCASVAADTEGNIYSYGPHYPLLFETSGRIWRNTAGYSSTTAKHISWAGGLEDHDVKLIGSDMSAVNIRRSLLKERDYIDAVIYGTTHAGARPKREGTKVRAALDARRDEIQAALRSLHNSNDAGAGSEAQGLEQLKTTGSVMALGDLFSESKEESNDWKLRMLKAGVPEGALHLPDDWDQLPEAEKEERLNKVIKEFTN